MKPRNDKKLKETLHRSSLTRARSALRRSLWRTNKGVACPRIFVWLLLFLSVAPWTLGAETSVPLLDGARDVVVHAAAATGHAEEAKAPLLHVDVEGCVRMALRGSGRALAAAEDVTARQADVNKAKAARRPTIKVQTGFLYIDGQQGGMSSPITRLLGVGNVAPSNEVAVAALQLQQVLYAGGRIRAAIRASRHLAVSEGWKRDAVLADLALETRKAYYDSLLAQALVEVASRSVETFDRHLADVRHFEGNGVVSHFEVLRAETELAARKTDRTSAETALELALLNLRRLTGIPQDTPLALDGSLAWREMDVPLPTLVAEATTQRAELRALDEAIAAAEEGVRVQRADYRPSAGVLVQYQEVDGGGQILPDGLVAGIGGQWTWYAGGKRKANVAEAKARQRGLEHQRTDVARLVEMDVRQAHARVREAVSKIRREDQSVKTAREGLRLAELRFREGAGTQTETLDADLALTTARTALARALHDYAVALASLERAVGKAVSEEATGSR